MLRIAMLIMPILLSACSVFGVRSGTEEPTYTVTRTAGGVELRQYGARVAAETDLDGDETAARGAGFRRLAGYIFGGNTARRKIAMTAPVAQSSGGAPGSEKIAMTAPVAQARDGQGRWTIRFFMPAGSTPETLPVPDDGAVRLVEVPAESVAVLRFTGSTAPDAVAARRAELLRALPAMGLAATSEPVAWFYDPPWTLPWLRRNEIAVAVRPA